MMNNFPQVSPMESLRAFGIAFLAGVVSTAAATLAVIIARQDRGL